MPTSSASTGDAAQTTPAPGRSHSWTDWGVSVINGFAGDRLRDRQNGLAIAMAFYHQGRPLPLTPARLSQALPAPTAKLCILVHGLGCHEGVWDFAPPAQPDRRVSYGALLQADLGYTPFFVRYNTGLSIVENGHTLAELLNDLLAAYPIPVEEIVLIGHSMGGLVLRSAGAYATRTGAPWAPRVRHVFYLGTPHEGAPLAKLGHFARSVLHAVNGPITRLLGNVIDRSSQGLKDLVSGAGGADDESHFQWLPGVQHYLIVGALFEDASHPIGAIIGDGLVSLPAQRGDDVILMPGRRHMRLTGDWDLYQHIRRLCAGD